MPSQSARADSSPGVGAFKIKTEITRKLSFISILYDSKNSVSEKPKRRFIKINPRPWEYKGWYKLFSNFLFSPC